ncbi:MAG: tRNA (N6-threonylcarbamoyladenosine(37)-N6)-methyltransferase TrmO [Candidatus Aminicenantes bacterium]|nr:tRNA (N6-threonylcarbamoyladenosine(37)-N6)-methyltransferase TrmO [Candidatus Aminicenantes bacterium]MDH5714495.1 tRNA (N6-threonylcarbamoyladenosine(37)-N6)-methyltransferase TrmO [Candidatus Aminicenantes bacterium]
MSLKAIGVVHSPFREPEEVPRGEELRECESQIEIYPEYVEGLKDVEGFSHLFILYWMHRAPPASLLAKPRLDDTMRGLFATRAPHRPNPLGLSLVRLIKVEGNILKVKGLDAIDQTSVIDIKPYIPGPEHRQEIKIGWLEGKIKLS